MKTNRHTINSLEELEIRKEELQTEIHKKGEVVAGLWENLFTEKKTNTRGEMIASIVSKSITAFDAFILARKLVKQYGNLFGKKKR
ncbi:MAG: hypothetical protein K2G86_09145 [Prevotella sp.]|nr:hypothetical protein [Prevotella sp.]